MWGQKFGFVLGSALSFPFKEFSKIRLLFLNAFVVITALIALIILLFIKFTDTTVLQTMMMQPAGTQVDLNTLHLPVWAVVSVLLLILLALLVTLPYRVGIIRSIVTGQNAEARVLTGIFTRRSMGYLWVNIKVALMIVLMTLPFIIVAIITLGSLAFVTTMSGGPDLSHLAGFSGATAILLTLMGIATIITMLYFIPRWLMALPSAALEQGTSLKTSRELSEGSWWLIVLSSIVLQIIVTVAVWLVSLLGGMIVAPLFLLAHPLVGIVIAGLLILFVTLFSMIPAVALLGYLYLVMKGQVKFGEVKLKKA